MASIWQNKSSRNWLIQFCYGGERYCRSCDTQKEGDAKRIKAAVEEVIGFLNTGRLLMPETVTDPGLWIVSGGKLDQKPKKEANRLTLVGEVCDAYYKDQLDKAVHWTMGIYSFRPSFKFDQISFRQKQRRIDLGLCRSLRRSIWSHSRVRRKDHSKEFQISLDAAACYEHERL